LTRALLLAGGALVLMAAAQPHVLSDGTQQAVRRWMDRHEAYAARAKRGDIDIIFLGDSLTYAWNVDGHAVWERDFAPMGAESFGIGGDRTEDVIWRVEHGELDGSGARVVVLEIGTNDLGTGSTADATADGVEACVRAIRARLPEAAVLVLSVLPRGEGGAATPIRRAIAGVNARLAKLDDGKHVRYLDVTGAFTAFDGSVRPELYHPDLIHLSPQGYQAWSDVIRPALARLRR
jgi:lysophospholipase L1-like esterase